MLQILTLDKSFICHVRSRFYYYFRNTHTLSFLDAGMVGNYGEARIFVRNHTSGYITGIWNSAFYYVFNAGMPTLNATDGLFVIAVIAWSTRVLFVEVVSVNSGISFNNDTR